MRKIKHILMMFFLMQTGFVFAQTQVMDTICIQNTNQAIYHVKPNPGSYFYWKVEGGNIISPQGLDSILVIWNPIPGIYTIQVLEVNSFGCPGDTVKAMVLIKDKPNVSISGPENVCVGETVLLQAAGASHYIWSNGEITPSIIVYADSTRTYSVRGYNDECGDDTAYWTVNVLPKPKADFTFKPSKPQLNENINFYYSGSNVSEWEWIFNDSIVMKSNQPNPSFTFNNAGLRTVSLVVRNKAGCVDTITYSFLFKKEAYIFVPNSFTPNGDGLNEEFKAIGTGITSFEMAIYNRWGEKLFESKDMNQGWDGTFKGKKVQEGVFIYNINAQGIDGKWHYLKGNISVIY